MTIKPKCAVFLAACLLIAAAASASAAQGGLVSSMELMMGVSTAGGISIVPANDVQPRGYTEDLAPTQVFEIIRPDMGPITVGRLTSSCTCVMAYLPKRSYAAGERALMEIRNVKSTPPNGATYAVFVQIASPIREVLQLDVFVKSNPQPISVIRPEKGVVLPVRPTSPGQPTVIIKGTPPARQVNDPSKPPPFTYENVTPYPNR